MRDTQGFFGTHFNAGSHAEKEKHFLTRKGEKNVTL